MVLLDWNTTIRRTQKSIAQHISNSRLMQHLDTCTLCITRIFVPQWVENYTIITAFVVHILSYASWQFFHNLRVWSWNWFYFLLLVFTQPIFGMSLPFSAYRWFNSLLETEWFVWSDGIGSTIEAVRKETSIWNSTNEHYQWQVLSPKWAIRWLNGYNVIISRHDLVS